MTAIIKENVSNIVEQIKLVIIIYGIICVLHLFSLKTPVPELMTATLISFAMVFISIVLKNFVRKPNLPGFAWATLVSFFLTIPISPVSNTIVSAMSAYSFSLVGLPLLAFAGIAVGEQLDVFRKLSWKIIIISFVVMASTYFFSAAIANIVLSVRGMI